jgi:putative redox protein
VIKPPTIVDLTWQDDLVFSVAAGGARTTLDSAGVRGLSPVQALGAALAGCLTTDVAYLLKRGRHPVRGLKSRLTGERAQQDPHRLVRISLQITVEGEVPPDAIDRAVQLSRDKYCSVWHSMRHDIDLQVSFAVVAPPA